MGGGWDGEDPGSTFSRRVMGVGVGGSGMGVKCTPLMAGER